MSERYRAVARRVGTELARRGHALIYGGARVGLMGAMADAALETGGTVHGVILDAFVARDVHHPGIDTLHQVDDMRKRKQGLDERADAFIALPGGLGTLEELAEMLSFRKLGLHERRIVLLNVDGFYDPLVAQLERFVSDGFDGEDTGKYLAITDDPCAAVTLCESDPR